MRQGENIAFGLTSAAAGDVIPQMGWETKSVERTGPADLVCPQQQQKASHRHFGTADRVDRCCKTGELSTDDSATWRCRMDGGLRRERAVEWRVAGDWANVQSSEAGFALQWRTTACSALV